MRKSRLRGFVVSISGGADSAAVSCLVAMMVDFGVAELGRERFLAKLAYFPEIQTAQSNRETVRQLLACVYQSTCHSGPVTLNAARGVAEAIGAEFFQFDVDKLVNDYVGMVSQAIGRPLSWERDDLALQNIQARVRSPGVWMLANLRGRCWLRPATALKRPSVMRPWMAILPAALAPSPASIKPFCAAGCAGWSRSGRLARRPLPPCMR